MDKDLLSHKKAISAKTISGSKIAHKILNNLSRQTKNLIKKGITPTLAVILVGEDPASLAYVRQKQKAADKIGGHLLLRHLYKNCSQKKIEEVIQQFNQNPTVHGVIVQLPLPQHLKKKLIIQKIDSDKDVDGFKQNSLFTPPVSSAVIYILKWIYYEVVKTTPKGKDDDQKMENWLKNQSIIVLGRGQTAGKPIAQTLIKHGCHVRVIHSQTKDPRLSLSNADIIISAVGKMRVVQGKDIKKGVILISVGLHRKNGHLHGDYEEADIATKSSFFTTTPGGVGPVNVACLWENVVKSAKSSI